MKISDEEAIAALNSWIPEIRPATCEAYVKDMRAALAAAYTVRKARKAAKRAKAKPSIFTHQSLYDNGQLHHWLQAVPEPVKPAWNGKFEVGKAYRTRDGQKAMITERHPGLYPFVGDVDASAWSWLDNGRHCGIRVENPLDLIGPWED
jgi:hypothetical protein